MLSDKDILILKLALERRVLNADSYPGLLAEIRKTQGKGGVARLLRGAGVSGRAVGVLVDLATATDGKGAIHARCDVENTLLERALINSRRVQPQHLEQGKRAVQAQAQKGHFYGLAEILVDAGKLDLLLAADLQRKVRQIVASCPRCFRQYFLRDRPQGHCPACRGPIIAGQGISAIDAWRPAGARGSSGTGRLARPPAGMRQDRPSGQLVAVDGLAPGQPQALPGIAPGLPGAAVPTGAPPPADESGVEVADVEHSIVIADEQLEVQEAVAQFGDYEIIKELARGGMGAVYKARRRGSPEIVALKVLIAGPGASEQALARFAREAQVAKRFDDPGIVKVFDAGNHQGYRYIAMEFAPGMTLGQAVETGPMDPERAARILATVSRAVHTIHQAKVIHRDLKPDNIILHDETNEPKLIDFGLVKAEGVGDKLTKTATALGTPTYMSPEQVRGEPATEAADIYGLGAILYNIVVGRVPFEGDNYMDLFRRIVQEPVELPSKVLPGVPKDLETIILKAMAKDTGKRYASAADLADDLERYLRGGKIAGERVVSQNAGFEPVEEFWKRPPVLIGAALLIGLVFLTLGFLLAN